MPLELLNYLMLEIERQIAFTSNSSHETPTCLSSNCEGLIIENRNHHFYLDLKKWCESLGQNDISKWEDTAVPTRFQKGLWNFFAFANSSTPVINPAYQQTRCIGIQDIRSRYDLSNSCMNEIWQSAHLRSWAASPRSSVITIQGTSQTIVYLEQFSCEITRQLNKIHPTLWMLSEPSTREFFAGKDEAELLRQLAIQGLRKILHFNLDFLLRTLTHVKDCATSDDWFKVLKTIFQFIPKVYLVVDLDVLGNRINQAKTWPRDFQSLISQLDNRCPSRISVMLLSSRPLLSGAPNALTIQVNHESRSRFQAARPRRTNSLRCISKIMSVVELCTDQPMYERGLALGKGDVNCKPSRETLASSLHDAKIPERSFTIWPGKEETTQNTFNTLESASSSVPPHRNSVAIAILCALPLEADAVCSIFDLHWDIQLYSNLRRDNNAYSVGRIGCHNVVLIHMPSVGRTPAATAAANCRISFPCVNLMIVVGICGAVPFHNGSAEILLGDVIVSDGLVIYDFGRQFPDKFKRKADINDCARKPPEEIRAFLSKLKMRSSQRTLHSRTEFHLRTLQDCGYPEYPGAAKDQLFEPSYGHRHQSTSQCVQCASSNPLVHLVCDIARSSTCDVLGCDPRRLIPRKRLSDIANGVNSWLPLIHFGVYASGDKVMKSGEHRDQIADGEGVIAFEMEGAGIWDSFPCFVIKGVCDYADSHKNKMWQVYAAATAAACLKAFLEVWPTRSPMGNHPVY
ncbi:nucleoside phosphorylase domain-containing protein [Xylariaceae sp. FL0255]|nr:nucleoside phosphorylase domain-containing protein [Xylariaceae sp. FL0255]